MVDIDTRLELFQDMIGCCHALYLWSYDSAFHLITSNCPEQTAINDLFLLTCNREEFYSQITENNTPVILTNEMGLMWVMAPYFQEKEFVRLYVLGPFFVDDIPPKSLEEQLGKHAISFPVRQEFLRFLRKLPVISLNRIFEYAVMLRMVREGDLSYQAHMDRMSVTGRLGKLSNGDPMRQLKNAVLVCITLFSRAAIEGGLTPEVSYTLTDHYFQSVEACSTVSELVEISHTMQADFIQRVHRCRTNDLSQPIQTCCDYISLHLEDKLSLELLAGQTGYTENYLSKKFKSETGMTPNEYIRRQRLERAALLLRTTQDDIQNISERLQFCSQSYFAEHFRRLFQMTPSEYRFKKTTDKYQQLLTVYSGSHI